MREAGQAAANGNGRGSQHRTGAEDEADHPAQLAHQLSVRLWAAGRRGSRRGPAPPTSAAIPPCEYSRWYDDDVPAAKGGQCAPRCGAWRLQACQAGGGQLSLDYDPTLPYPTLQPRRAVCTARGAWRLQAYQAGRGQLSVDYDPTLPYPTSPYPTQRRHSVTQLALAPRRLSPVGALEVVGEPHLHAARAQLGLAAVGHHPRPAASSPLSDSSAEAGPRGPCRRPPAPHPTGGQPEPQARVGIVQSASISCERPQQPSHFRRELCVLLAEPAPLADASCGG